MKCRWRKTYTITTGSATITEPAAMSVRSDVLRPWKTLSPSGAVSFESSVIITSTSRNSFQVHMNSSTPMVSTAGLASGSSTRQRVNHEEAPSSRAASTSDLGTVRK